MQVALKQKRKAVNYTAKKRLRFVLLLLLLFSTRGGAYATEFSTLLDTSLIDFLEKQTKRFDIDYGYKLSTSNDHGRFNPLFVLIFYQTIHLKAIAFVLNV